MRINVPALAICMGCYVQGATGLQVNLASGSAQERKNAIQLTMHCLNIKNI